MAYWLDYSAAKLDGQTIKRAGYPGVIRYIDSPANLGWKHTTKAEYASHRAAGLDIRMVMQTTTTASAGGFPPGVEHARRALAGAQYLGFGGVIYFTNDRTTLPNPLEWQAYLRGAVSVLGRSRVGAYGFGNAMDAARGIVDHFWQAGRRSDVRPFVQIWQDNNTQVTVGGVLCDRNLILKPLSTEDDMPTLKEMLDTKLGLNGDTAFEAWADKPGTLGHWYRGQRQYVAGTRIESAAITDAVDDLSEKVDALSVGGVDVAALASQVAALLAPAVAAAVADEVAKRMAA